MHGGQKLLFSIVIIESVCVLWPREILISRADTPFWRRNCERRKEKNDSFIIIGPFWYDEIYCKKEYGRWSTIFSGYCRKISNLVSKKHTWVNNPGWNPSPVRHMEITIPFCWKSRFRQKGNRDTQGVRHH